MDCVLSCLLVCYRKNSLFAPRPQQHELTAVRRRWHMSWGRAVYVQHTGMSVSCHAHGQHIREHAQRESDLTCGASRGDLLAPLRTLPWYYEVCLGPCGPLMKALVQKPACDVASSRHFRVAASGAPPRAARLRLLGGAARLLTVCLHLLPSACSLGIGRGP